MKNFPGIFLILECLRYLCYMNSKLDKYKNNINESDYKRPRVDVKRLTRNLTEMGYDLDDAKEEIESLFIWFDSLPSKLTLYRILQVDDESDINLKKLGSHYSDTKKELVGNHCYAVGYGENKFLVTIIADKIQVDVSETLSNRILYPNENEITLKNKGLGVEIVSIKKVCDDNERYIGKGVKKRNIKESIETNHERYYNYIINDMVKDTRVDLSNKRVFTPFNYPISNFSSYPIHLLLSHNVSIWSEPDSFRRYIQMKYGVRDSEFNIIWKMYIKKIQPLLTNEQ